MAQLPVLSTHYWHHWLLKEPAVAQLPGLSTRYWHHWLLKAPATAQLPQEDGPSKTAPTGKRHNQLKPLLSFTGTASMHGQPTVGIERHGQHGTHTVLGTASEFLLPRQQRPRRSLQPSRCSPEGLLSPPKEISVSEQRLHPLMIVLGG